ncbi:type II toxin-antitoxin system PemK/MazF family toxin [Psychromicrobium lacuslunae]|uniref:Growth inhibitor PemK n=1 Tax=Psychromicrobium lacuslunae TaxID=1618207 RepID=A0A0D4BY20_9MICC|nr:type II toxin-antitoxin system PemK/MazF family toxin [Psychromicrobium lacuslunae]AJT41005.1 growth inhibitor PemK [Psychromicrobium lacuslunae]
MSDEAADYHGPGTVRYAPQPDGEPDPGEIVWTWVPFEDDPTQGKDRPVLLIGNDGPWLLGLMMTSKDHVQGSAVDQRTHRDYVDVGIGGWDKQQRASEVRVDRILRIAAEKIRREGAVLGAEPFNQVADALRLRHGWR